MMRRSETAETRRGVLSANATSEPMISQWLLASPIFIMSLIRLWTYKCCMRTGGMVRAGELRANSTK